MTYAARAALTGLIVLAVLLALPALTRAAATVAAMPTLGTGAGPVRSSGPAPSSEPPKAVDFEVAWLSHPDAQGVFRGSILVHSRLADTRVKVLLNPTEGIEILQAPKKLSGTARKGVPTSFEFTARIAPAAPRPAGLNVELRLIYPAAAAVARYGTTLPETTLERLEGWAAMDRGGPLLKLDRAFFFPEGR